MTGPKSRHQKRKDPDEGHLAKCIVDIYRKKFYLYCDKGNEKVIECKTIDEFIKRLNIARTICDYGAEFLPKDVLEYIEL